MTRYTKMQTRWEPGQTGDLLCAHSGDPAWTNITERSDRFPMSVRDVATLMNKAFAMGAMAKAAEIQAALRLGTA